jgi:geranylgeranyl pyrophosphate synthase
MEIFISMIRSIPIAITDKLYEVEELMRRQADSYHPDLQSAMKHLLSSGGKRVRPTLTLLIGDMLGGPHDRLVTLAAAIEMLHTATLVHDDLIDGSLLRRGMATLNSQWTPGATVLTGDFIFARAAKLASDTDSIPVMSIFSTTLGVIVNGEINQLFASRCVTSRPDYYSRIYAKTASLFETATTSAAFISEASSEVTTSIRRFGHDIGMAFQIMDDILDFTADPSVLGKPVGSDLRSGLVTLPVIFFTELHPEHPVSQALLAGKCLSIPQIEELVPELRSSGSITRAHNEARQFVSNGLEALSSSPDCMEKQALEELAQYFVDRVL